MQRRSQRTDACNKFFEQAVLIRKVHPHVGCRKIARQLREPGWGRDKIEQLLLHNGYRVQYPRNYTKTTHRQRQYTYPNLIEGMELNNMHQVVQTDITYYRVGERFYYLTFFIDVYSRYISGYAVSKTLEARANINALKMLLRNRPYDHSKLIHHSDKGSQYITKGYLKLLGKYDIKLSMCNEAWENAYTERINRTIKEEYLNGWKIKSYRQLQYHTAKAVRHYNEKRQHQSLQWQTPKDYEFLVSNLPAAERPVMKLYKQPML